MPPCCEQRAAASSARHSTAQRGAVRRPACAHALQWHLSPLFYHPFPARPELYIL